MARVRSIGLPWIHSNVQCDNCEIHPIIGHRLKCTTCPDHDLCLRCFTQLITSQELEQCNFLLVEVDSSEFRPPYQIRYIICHSCHATPIKGPRYRNTKREFVDLCSDCILQTSNSEDFEEVEETKIHTLCKTYCPVFHFHKKCQHCGQQPIFGPRFDIDRDQSLCQTCFDLKRSRKPIDENSYERVDRPEEDFVVHLSMFCCMQCGEIPICGPAFVSTRDQNESLCLQCYQNLDPSRWEFHYQRVDPPLQYGEPPLLSSSSARHDQNPPNGKQNSEDRSNGNDNSKKREDEDDDKPSNRRDRWDRWKGNDYSRRNDADIDKLSDRLNSAILDEKPDVKWDDVAGLEAAKQALREAVVFPIKFPQFFEGDRKPWNAFLLYGPPGTGKSYLAKAVATEVSSTFFSISSSDLKSKWHGESEQLVSLLFEKAREAAPSVIFIDEIDSVAATRSEQDISSMKTEILVQMQGVGTKNDKVLVLAATNLPYNLDQAIRRRFDKRIYIPLPEQSARKDMFKIHLRKTPNSLTDADFEDLANRTPGFSGSDISVCVKDVLWEPLRKIQASQYFRQDKGFWYPCEFNDPRATKITMKELENKTLASKIKPLPICRADFEKTLQKQRPTVSQADLELHHKFTEEFGDKSFVTGSQSVFEEPNGLGSGSNSQSVAEEPNVASSRLEYTPGSSIVKENPRVKWSDVAGMENAKRLLYDSVIGPVKHLQFFNGRGPITTCLLYGPPGCGKSHIAKAVATEAHSVFFRFSALNIASSWRGEGCTLLPSLFQQARSSAPSIIFIDKIDSISTCSSEFYMRFKTEFLTQLQILSSSNDKVLILASTNSPYAIDAEIIWKFEKRIHVPLPEESDRAEIFRIHLGSTPHWLTYQDFEELARRTAFYSSSDILECVKMAINEPVRRLQTSWFFTRVYSDDPSTPGKQLWTPCDQYATGAYATTLRDLEAQGWGDSIRLPPVVMADFEAALATRSPTFLHPADLEAHIRFMHEFGEG